MKRNGRPRRPFLQKDGGIVIMMENTMKNIPAINAVDAFNPAEFTRQLPNEDGSASLYLDVKYACSGSAYIAPTGKSFLK